MEHGRPSRSTQIQIQRALRKYYDLGVSATIAAERTGINTKTASKYFDEWSEQISERESADFIERQKKERVRAINTFDLMIIEVSETLEKMKLEEEEIARQGKSRSHLYATKLRAMQFLADLVEKRASFAMKPAIDEALKSQIGEMVNNAKNRQDN